jgi:hypothetical protein
MVAKLCPKEWPEQRRHEAECAALAPEFRSLGGAGGPGDVRQVPSSCRRVAGQRLSSDGWWSRWDSNPRPRRCKRRALPTELRPLFARLRPCGAPSSRVAAGVCRPETVRDAIHLRALRTAPSAGKQGRNPAREAPPVRGSAGLRRHDGMRSPAGHAPCLVCTPSLAPRSALCSAVGRIRPWSDRHSGPPMTVRAATAAPFRRSRPRGGASGYGARLGHDRRDRVSMGRTPSQPGPVTLRLDPGDLLGGAEGSRTPDL